jgi:hypothetical protein
MKRTIDLGTFVETGDLFTADLDIVLRSNALVQANSGGGKSWLLRRMIEQAFGKVPQIVIDPEGEFSTLRAKFDFVLVGKGGDTPADLRSAELLAHRLLELGASAVVDLYEMSKTQRPFWVAAFVQALVDAPKKLWRDLLVYVDEAHEMAPELGHGARESAGEKTCRHALIDLAAKGRKRGYGVVAATQRLGKLSKDFAAELKNVLVGQTFIDVDRERASGSLGIAKVDKATFFRDVKTLTPGRFYALGRAFVLEPTLVMVGGVVTEHPEAGRRQSAPPPPTDKIRHLLPQLGDLPKEAEVKLATEKDLRAEVSRLKASLSKLESQSKRPATVEVERLPREVLAKVTEAIKKVEGVANWAMRLREHLKWNLESHVAYLEATLKECRDVSSRGKMVTRQAGLPGEEIRATSSLKSSLRVSTSEERGEGGAKPDTSNQETRHLPKGARDIVRVLSIRYPTLLTRTQLATLAGLSPNSGTFSTYISLLNTEGYLDNHDGKYGLSVAGTSWVEANFADCRSLDETPKDLLRLWSSKMPGAAKNLLAIFAREHGPLDRSTVAGLVGMSPSSGTFSTYLSKLTSNGLVTKTSEGYVVCEELAL